MHGLYDLLKKFPAYLEYIYKQGQFYFDTLVNMTLISTLKGPSEVVVKFLNDKFKAWQPAEIVIFTAGASLVTAYIYSELTYKVLQMRQV